jgi:hypothetical protein
MRSSLPFDDADSEDMLKTTNETRPLGLVVSAYLLLYACNCDLHQRIVLEQLVSCVQVCRGTAVMMVSPTAGTEELAQNPFLQGDAAG